MYEKITLPNGARICCEHIDHLRSATLGLWVMSGSRNEPAALGGISHFIEHMNFKGTARYSCNDIADISDKFGGQMNAYTTKEYTCFYVRALDYHLSSAVDLLSDMVFFSTYDEAALATERGVILEEIGMYADTPEDLVSERLCEKVFSGSSLARPILGTKRTLAGIDGNTMRNFVRENYSPDRVLASISGNFSQRDIELLSETLSKLPPAPAKRRQPKCAVYTPGCTFKQKKTEQNHIVICWESDPVASEDRFVLSVLSSILGGGMSSRLFKKVREEYGLCYSIYTFLTSHVDTGLFGIYTATGTETEARALELINGEINRFLDEGPDAQEVERIREQTKASILLSLESTTSRMNSMARGELFTGKALTPDEVIERYDAVTREDVLAVARRILRPENRSLSVVGRLRSADEYAALI